MSKSTIILSDLPPELLKIIALNLSNIDMTILIRTCTLMHDIVAAELYRNVTAYDARGRRYFRTIIESTTRHGSLTRSLSFVGLKNADIYSTFSLFAAALPRLEYLVTLSITACPDRTPYLFHALGNTTYHSRTNVTLRPDRSIVLDVNEIQVSLPNVRVLALHGDCKLTRFAIGNNISTLFISTWMSEKQLGFFISCLTTTSMTNTTLIELHIRFDVGLAADIAKPLTVLGRTFMNLQRLSILTPRGDALKASEALTASPPLFPRMTTFRLNDWADTYYQQIWLSKKETLEEQRQHIIDAAKIRDGLNTLAFGHIHWTKNQLDNWTMQEKWAPYRVPLMTNTFDYSPVIQLRCYFDLLQKGESDELHYYLIHNDEALSITQLQYPLDDSSYATEESDTGNSDASNSNAENSDADNSDEENTLELTSNTP